MRINPTRRDMYVIQTEEMVANMARVSKEICSSVEMVSTVALGPREREQTMMGMEKV